MAMAHQGMNLYEVLGVPATACHEEIRQSYKREALRNHPDKNQDRVAEATEAFKLVSEAYSILRDPRSRADYDLQLSQPWSNVHGRAGYHRSDFSFNKASDIFKEAFGEQFVAGLLRVAQKAAPHVQAAAEATASAVATAWDRFSKVEPPHARVGQRDSNRSFPSATPAAKPDAWSTATSSAEVAESSAASAAHAAHVNAPASTGSTMPASASGACAAAVTTGTVVDVDGHHLLHCTLRWRTHGLPLELCLSAYIAGDFGMHLGCVDSLLGKHAVNVAAQFRECGVEHLGASVPRDGVECTETISLDLCKVAQNEMFRYIFLRIYARGGASGGLSSLPLLEFQVTDVRRCRSLFVVNVAEDGTLSHEGGAMVALLQRVGETWFATPVLLPCGEHHIEENRLEGTLEVVVGKAEDYARKHREALREAEESEAVAAAVATSQLAAGAKAAPLSRPNALSTDDEQLAESVEVNASNRNYEAAVEAQEELIRRMMEYEAQEGNAGIWEPRLAREFARMDELWRLVAETAPDSPLRSLSSQYAGEASELQVPEPEPTLAPAVAVSDTAAQPTTAAPATGHAATSKLIASEAIPLEPGSGSAAGGTQLRWLGEGSAPLRLEVGGRPCAPLAGGVHVAPACHIQLSEGGIHTADVCVVKVDGGEIVYPDAFTYWTPGQLLAVEPGSGPIKGARQLRVTTSNLGASISGVCIGGIACELLGTPSPDEALVMLPSVKLGGDVPVRVQAANGNQAIYEQGFHYYVPEAFGAVGENIELSEEGRKARRVEGVSKGVCIGAAPMHRFAGGRYFEIVVDEEMKSARALAVGVLAGKATLEEKLHHGRFLAQEANELQRVWLAGYDKGGAIFLSDGRESKIPPATWRPVKDVKVGTRLGVLWAAATPTLVVFQDGEERLRLPAEGRLPQEGEDVFAVVDLQGTTRCVTLVENPTPPMSVLQSAG